MDRIVDQAGSRSLISTLSIVELESVLAIKMRTGETRKLLVRYAAQEGLRTLDALQLAMALDLRQAAHISVLVTSDQRLLRVTALAGCSAVNPEHSGPLLI